MSADDHRAHTRSRSRQVGAVDRLARTTGASELAILARSAAGRALLAAVAVIAAATAIGLAALWSTAPEAPAEARDAVHLKSSVTEVRDRACPGPGEGAGTEAQQCRTIVVDPAGPRPAGEITLGPTEGSPKLSTGDEVIVSPVVRPEGTPSDFEVDPYSYLGVDRSERLFLACALLGLIALLALRWRGVLAIAGVFLSLALLVEFLVPAMLAGHAPVLVALTSGLAVMFVTLTLTNGIGAQTMASAVGIALTLLLTTALGVVAAQALDLDGTGGDLSTLLAQVRPGLSLQGVLLAGMVIGALGVLADTAVTQASAVMSLRHTDPGLGPLALYRRAVRIGQDHLAATIHTLVLAYAGTALPLLLVLQASSATGLDTINQIDVVEPIVASLVGCAGLIAAVPLTTALAAFIIARIPANALPESHGHAH